MDNLDTLAHVLYGRYPTAREYSSWTNAKIFIDAAEYITHLRAELNALHLELLTMKRETKGIV